MAAPSQYVRIDSALASNDKVLNLADDLWLEATGLYILMVCRCDLGSTDGSLDVKSVVGARGIAPGRDDLLAEIVRAKLARRRGDIVTIPDYLEWQRSSDEKLSATERARKAGRLRHSKGEKDASGNASGNASETASGKRAFCSAEQASKEREIDSQQEEKQRVASLPPCMDTTQVVHPVTGSVEGCMPMPSAVHLLAQKVWGVMSQRDLQTFTAAIRDGCHPDCDGNERQRDFCYALLKRTITDTRMEGPFRQRVRLFAKIVARTDDGGDRRAV